MGPANPGPASAQVNTTLELGSHATVFVFTFGLLVTHRQTGPASTGVASCPPSVPPSLGPVNVWAPEPLEQPKSKDEARKSQGAVVMTALLLPLHPAHGLPQVRGLLLVLLSGSVEALLPVVATRGVLLPALLALVVVLLGEHARAARHGQSTHDDDLRSMAPVHAGYRTT